MATLVTKYRYDSKGNLVGKTSNDSLGNYVTEKRVIEKDGNDNISCVEETRDMYTSVHGHNMDAITQTTKTEYEYTLINGEWLVSKVIENGKVISETFFEDFGTGKGLCKENNKQVVYSYKEVIDEENNTVNYELDNKRTTIIYTDHDGTKFVTMFNDPVEGNQTSSAFEYDPEGTLYFQSDITYLTRIDFDDPQWDGDCHVELTRRDKVECEDHDKFETHHIRYDFINETMKNKVDNITSIIDRFGDIEYETYYNAGEVVGKLMRTKSIKCIIDGCDIEASVIKTYRVDLEDENKKKLYNEYTTFEVDGKKYINVEYYDQEHSNIQFMDKQLFASLDTEDENECPVKLVEYSKVAENNVSKDTYVYYEDGKLAMITHNINDSISHEIFEYDKNGNCVLEVTENSIKNIMYDNNKKMFTLLETGYPLAKDVFDYYYNKIIPLVQ